MSAQSDEAMRLLRECHAMLATLTSGRSVTSPSVASATDLDGPHGDPVVKAKSPRDWTGADMTGKRFSECPAEYLDLVAARLDYFAAQNALEAANDALADEARKDAEKKAFYNRKDAARARGWAARIRAGWKHPATPEAQGERDTW